MRLYYVTTLEMAKKYILPERRRRLSGFDRLNDRVELSSMRLEGKLSRKIKKKLFDRCNPQLREIIVGARCKACVGSFENLVQPDTQPVTIRRGPPSKPLPWFDSKILWRLQSSRATPNACPANSVKAALALGATRPSEGQLL